jgi:type I restriction enzyme R subunit
VTQTPDPKPKKPTKVAEGKSPYTVHQLDILSILEARNDQEKLKGEQINEFELKINEFFAHVNQSEKGKRLITKIKSNVSENEIYDDFAKIYREYKVFNRKTVGDYFFKEMEDLVNKLCDDFENIVRNSEQQG